MEDQPEAWDPEDVFEEEFGLEAGRIEACPFEAGGGVIESLADGHAVGTLHGVGGGRQAPLSAGPWLPRMPGWKR